MPTCAYSAAEGAHVPDAVPDIVIRVARMSHIAARRDLPAWPASCSGVGLAEVHMAGDGSMEGACFDFEDMKALRDEYEERVRRAERERDAAVDVLKRDAEQRIATLQKDAEQRISTLQRDHEARLVAEATARQELIEELTVELASAREEGERRARAADEQRLKGEALLRKTLADVSRIEGELGRLREVLTAQLQPPAPVASAPVPPPASIVPSMGLASRSPPPLPADAMASTQTSVAAAWAAKKKKIRLR